MISKSSIWLQNLIQEVMEVYVVLEFSSFGPKLLYYLNFCCTHKVDGIFVLGQCPSTK